MSIFRSFRVAVSLGYIALRNLVVAPDPSTYDNFKGSCADRRPYPGPKHLAAASARG